MHCVSYSLISFLLPPLRTFSFGWLSTFLVVLTIVDTYYIHPHSNKQNFSGFVIGPIHTMIWDNGRRFPWSINFRDNYARVWGQELLCMVSKVSAWDRQSTCCMQDDWLLTVSCTDFAIDCDWALIKWSLLLGGFNKYYNTRCFQPTREPVIRVFKRNNWELSSSEWTSPHHQCALASTSIITLHLHQSTLHAKHPSPPLL